MPGYHASLVYPAVNPHAAVGAASNYVPGTLSPAQLSRIISFVRTDGSFGLSRVLWTMLRSDAYVAVSNWLVFEASTLQALRLCDLVLVILYSQPAAQRDVRSLRAARRFDNINRPRVA